MKNLKSFIIERTEKNEKWVKNNLEAPDFLILNDKIALYYRHDFQKRDILKVINN
jgi:hypothetical protein